MGLRTDLKIIEYLEWAEWPDDLLVGHSDGYKELLVQTWDRYREVLEEDGYSTLRELRTGIQERAAAAAQQVQYARGKKILYDVALEEIRRETISYASVRYGLDPNVNSIEESPQWKKALDDRLGEHPLWFGSHEGTGEDTALGTHKLVAHNRAHLWWKIVSLPAGDPDSEGQVNHPEPFAAIIFDPPKADLEARLGSSASIPKDGPRIRFGSDDTWRSAMQRMERFVSLHARKEERWENTRSLLEFDLGVIDNVLYRFEVFGKVGPLSNDLMRYASRDLPDIFKPGSAPLWHAERIQEWYLDVREVPTTMSKLKSALGSGGATSVETIQRALRKADMADRYDHGDPESFCNLVVDLVEAHYQSGLQ